MHNKSAVKKIVPINQASTVIRHHPTVIIPNLWVIQKNKMHLSLLSPPSHIHSWTLAEESKSLRISAPADSTLTQILRFFLAQILLKWEYTFFPSAIYGLTSCFNHYSAKTATKKNNLHSRTLTQSAALLACNPWKTESLDWSLVWDVMLIGSICVPGDRCIVGT